MCGISGVYHAQAGFQLDRERLRRMNDALAHRGPDDAGLFVEGGIGLGHRRLSIIDLGGGHQPLFNAEGSVGIVFNGEIYNYRELAVELREAGYEFQTDSDTEVIVHAWSHWGRACVEHFRGMFTFALWDKRDETLFLARDRLGVKPLYYAHLPDGQLIFASELKGLLAYGGIERDWDKQAIEDYFTLRYVPENKCIYRSVRKLPPAHVITFKRGEPMPSPRRYWDIPFKAVQVDDLDRELIEHVADAVKSRTIADVPLGAFLSGGVDSSAVVAMMARDSDEPVNTCAISFGDPRYNEAAYAQEVAERYGTRHRVEQVDSEDYDLIDTLAATYDEPYSDSSALPTYRVCQLARRHVTVALSGDGGDENFAGYRRYRWHMDEENLRSRVPAGLRGLMGPVASIYPRAPWLPRVLRAKATLTALSSDWIDGYLRLMSQIEPDERFAMYSPAFKSELSGYTARQVFEDAVAERPTDHPLSRVQYLDMKTYLPGDILTKVDRASMAHALEVREPILDHRLMEWVSGLPPEQKLAGTDGKHALKRALKPYLSDNILYRPKQGFAVPVAEWFRGPLKGRVSEAVNGERMGDTGLFDRSFLRRILDDHLTGRRDFSAILWALVMFDAFLGLEDKAA
ncbi:MAG: XrtA/PEP-CTERM system amidotransferase [Gammaproteobacteria bacterium]